MASENCWFCKKNPANGKSYEVRIIKVIETLPGFQSLQINYQKLKVLIPRCKPCAIKHILARIAKYLGFIAAIGLAVYGFVYWIGNQTAVLFIIGGVAYLLIWAGNIAWKFYLETYPELDMKIKAGWIQSKKPGVYDLKD